MAKRSQKLDRFDPVLAGRHWVNPWQVDGTYKPDFELLVSLLNIAIGSAQRSGMVAAAVDLWAAEELRRAGFDEDDVWPRRSQPRVLPRDVRNFVEGGALPKELKAQVKARYGHARARSALPAEARVLGAAYTKQADVLVASWATGVEMLISTKTMLSSFHKNLRNRFEEGYGDAKNLRGRHPLAVLGFLYVVSAAIPTDAFDFAVDMLRKLVHEPDVYDCACLLVVDGAQGVQDEEEEEDDRGPEEDPALVPLTVDDAADEEAAALEPETSQEPAPGTVALQEGRVPADLSAPTFFATLIREALDRMPIAMYPEVRERAPY